MNKAELIDAVAEKTGQSKKATTESINSVFDAISEALKAEGKVQIPGFGTFAVKERAARDGINPRTKEKIRIEAVKTVKFAAGKALKDNL